MSFQTIKERRSLERYLASMRCRACNGKGRCHNGRACPKCEGTGNSKRFEGMISRYSNYRPEDQRKDPQRELIDSTESEPA